MDDLGIPLPHEVPAQAGDQGASTSPTRRVRRGRRLVAVTAASVLVTGAAGLGIGYAAVRGFGQGPADSSSSSAASTGRQGLSSSQQLPPGYSFGYGQYAGPDQQASPTDPFGDQGLQGGSSTDTGTDTSTDTTSTASGSQLTGLVRIVSTMKYDGGKAAGTGMVLTSDGEVITNHHVVEGATSVKVKVMSSGATYTATVVGTDATADVAVLQLKGASGLATVTTGTAGVSAGDAVTAVGDGNGTVGYLSAATGSVLATQQSITTQSEGSASGESLSDLIQISSDVVSGYSGGATYDEDGEVVGMTTAASSGTSDVVGYAIPISQVLSIADDLEKGVTSASYDYGYPAFLGVGLGSGTTVEGVYDGTPAADAGIAAGDSITRVGGITVTTQTQLRAAVASHSPGDSVSVTWTDASGTSRTRSLTLAKGPVQ
jgi:S1-C subfamily serine protease